MLARRFEPDCTVDQERSPSKSNLDCGREHYPVPVRAVILTGSLVALGAFFFSLASVQV